VIISGPIVAGKIAPESVIKDDLLCISPKIHGFVIFFVVRNDLSDRDIFASTLLWVLAQKKPSVLNNLKQDVFVKDMK